LKARHVIHTVGPIYQAGDPLVPQQLASAYRRSLEVAEANGIRTIAFPSISTGTYGYPIKEASTIYLQAFVDYVMVHQIFDRIRFVLFDDQTRNVYAQTLNQMLQTDSEIIKLE